jgi:hypothetical protein
MTTRSITRIFALDRVGEKSHLVSFYLHSDGNPKGHGKDLAVILTSARYVSGLPITPDSRILGNYFNGPGCAAASIISLLKDEPGGIYLVPEKQNGMFEEWEYAICIGDTLDQATLEIFDTRDGRELYFKGSPQSFLNEIEE